MALIGTRDCSQRFCGAKSLLQKYAKSGKIICDGVYRYVEQIILNTTKQIEAKVRFECKNL